MSSTVDQPSDHPDPGDDTLAIDLRIRLLECIFAGALPSSDSFLNRIKSETSTKNSVAFRVERILTQLSTILDTKPNEAIRRFVQSYDLNEPLLHLPNPLSVNKLSSELSLSVSEKTGLVLEADSEIIQLERDLREIELLDSRGVVGAGKLADGNWSASELDSGIVDPLAECQKTIADLERRATNLMSRYDSYVNSLSEIFISWDAILSSVEDDIRQLRSARTS